MSEMQERIEFLVKTGHREIEDIGDRTTLLRFRHPYIEGPIEVQSSCHDARHYKRDVGAAICEVKLKKELWRRVGRSRAAA